MSTWSCSSRGSGASGRRSHSTRRARASWQPSWGRSRRPDSIHARSLVGPQRAAAAPPATEAAAGISAAPVETPRSTVRQPLVGRHGERAEIVERIAAAADHAAPAALLFLGEPGMGKTRLLEVVADAARARGGGVLAGRAFEGEMVRPYGPWVDALRSAALGPAVEGLRGDLAALLPELGADGAGVDWNRLFGAVGQLVTRLADCAPLAIVLDDLQWLDEASAALLHHLVRNPPAGVFIASGARTAELSDNAPVQRLVRALSRERRLVERPLAPLDEAEVALLVRESVRAGVEGVDAAQVFARSGGNPYFTVEIAGALARGDDVVPESLAAMIDERLARLDPVTRNLVPWAAAMRRGFDLERLAQASGVAPGDLLSAVGELEHHRILVVTEAPGGAGYDFAHDLVRERAYRALSEPRRRLIHRQIARVLSKAGALDGASGGEVAHHAALGGDHELAAHAALAGGRHAIRIFAGEEAGRLARFGAQHAAELSLGQRLPLRVALLGVLAYSNTWRGRSAELEEELVSTIAECEMAGLQGAAAAGFETLSLVQYEVGKLDSAMTSSLRSLKRADTGGPRARAEALACVARCLTLVERDMPRAEDLLGQARDASGPEGDHLLELQWGQGMFERFVGKDAQAVASLERALQLARQVQNRWSQFECLMGLTRIDLEDGRPARARGRCVELLEVAEKMTDGSELAIARALEAVARALLGEAGADAPLEAALSALRCLDAKGTLTCVLGLWAQSDLEAGRLDRAKAHAAEAVKAAEVLKRRSDGAVSRALLGSVLLALGDRPASDGRAPGRLRQRFRAPRTERVRPRAPRRPRRGARVPASSDRYDAAVRGHEPISMSRGGRLPEPHATHNPPTGAPPMPHIIVEYAFDPPATEEELDRMAEQLGPCLEGRDVRFVQSFVALDRRRRILRLRGGGRRDGSCLVPVGERRLRASSGPPSRSRPDD